MKGDREGFQKNRSLELIFEKIRLGLTKKEDIPSRADSREKSLQVEMLGMSWVEIKISLPRVEDLTWK